MRAGRPRSQRCGGIASAYAYPAANNKLSSETINGTLARSMTYDGGGNLLTGLPVGAAYSIVYNKRNRPVNLKLNGTIVGTYYYSAEEQLASRSLVSPLTPVGFTHYVYDLDGHLIAEATGATAAAAVITREYIWLGDMPVMVIDGVNTASPVLSAVHTDHLMRPIKITNAAKASTWDATWLPWGGAHVTTGTTAMSLRFPGQYFLIEQGLAYNWHRMYDQSTGRYTQADPLGFVGGPSLYAYAINSPLTYIDELGLAGGTPTNPQIKKCASLKRRIDNLTKEIERQTKNLASNPQSLPFKIGPGEALSSTVRGHQTLLNKYWSQRNKLYDQWRDNKCDGDGGSCPECGGAALSVIGVCALCLAAPEVCVPVTIGGVIAGSASR